ncbi:MAG: GTP pyrophosphokinase family protein [bacterium]
MSNTNTNTNTNTDENLEKNYYHELNWDSISWKDELIPYKQATEELFVKFIGIKKEYVSCNQHSPIEVVQTRVKSINSILNKAVKKGIAKNKIFEQIEDIAGIRITCKFIEDIYKVVELIKERDNKDLVIIKEEDYIANNKVSGYRSYHINILYNVITVKGSKTIPCEIQIRTMAMNFWATIEHSIRYKYSGFMPDNIKERLQACAEASFALDTEMATIRDEIIQADKVIQIQEALVGEILDSLQSLYFVGKFEEANEFNKQFIELYEDLNIESLRTFRNKVKTIAELYRFS